MPALQQIADVLNALLVAELSSSFAAVVAGMPYTGSMDRRQARKVIRYIAESDARRCRDIDTLMRGLGMEPDVVRSRPVVIEPYLSLRYLGPALLAAKQNTLQSYRDATVTLGSATQSIADLLRRHLTEHAGELDVLSAALLPESG